LRGDVKCFEHSDFEFSQTGESLEVAATEMGEELNACKGKLETLKGI